MTTTNETNVNAEREQAAEVVKLMDSLSHMKAALAKKDAEIAEMDSRRTAGELKRAACAALEAAGCTKAELVYRAIRDNLVRDPDGKIRATARVDGLMCDFGLNDYIARVAKTEIPEMFRRPGAPVTPASGGGADKGYDYTEEQIADTEFYLANRDKIEKAYAAGRVRPKQRQR